MSEARIQLEGFPGQRWQVSFLTKTPCKDPSPLHLFSHLYRFEMDFTASYNDYIHKKLPVPSTSTNHLLGAQSECLPRAERGVLGTRKFCYAALSVVF